MKVILARHSESKKNIGNRFDQSNDEFDTLTTYGIRQVEILGQFLNSTINKKSSLIITGSRKKAYDTASILSELISCNYIVDSNLRSINAGVLAGLTNIEAWEKLPKLMKNRVKFSEGDFNGYDLVFPEGDDLKEFESKIKLLLIGHMKKYSKFDNLIYITHRSVILAMLNIFNKLFDIQSDSDYHYFDTPTGSLDIINVLSRDFEKGEIRRLGGVEVWGSKN